MSDLTNTPKREPSYGKSAARYTMEREFGRKALELLRGDDPCTCDMTPRLDGTAAPKCIVCRLDEAAITFGLIDADAEATRRMEARS